MHYSSKSWRPVLSWFWTIGIQLAACRAKHYNSHLTNNCSESRQNWSKAKLEYLVVMGVWFSLFFQYRLKMREGQSWKCIMYYQIKSSSMTITYFICYMSNLVCFRELEREQCLCACHLCCDSSAHAVLLYRTSCLIYNLGHWVTKASCLLDFLMVNALQIQRQASVNAQLHKHLWEPSINHILSYSKGKNWLKENLMWNLVQTV